MPRISLGVLLAILLLEAGCGYGSNYMNGNGTPTINELSPGSTAAGGIAFTLTVEGTRFGPDSLVYWGTTTRATTYVSASEVKASITDTDIMNAGTVQVYVHTGGANSNAMTFTITQ